jgi:hypothetical protein
MLNQNSSRCHQTNWTAWLTKKGRKRTLQFALYLISLSIFSLLKLTAGIHWPVTWQQLGQPNLVYTYENEIILEIWISFLLCMYGGGWRKSSFTVMSCPANAMCGAMWTRCNIQICGSPNVWELPKEDGNVLDWLQHKFATIFLWNPHHETFNWTVIAFTQGGTFNCSERERLRMLHMSIYCLVWYHHDTTDEKWNKILESK